MTVKNCWNIYKNMISAFFLNYSFALSFFILACFFILIIPFINIRQIHCVLFILSSILMALTVIEIILSFNMPKVKYMPDLAHTSVLNINEPKFYFNIEKKFGDIKIIRNNNCVSYFNCDLKDVYKDGDIVVYDKVYSLYSNSFRYTKSNIDSDEAYIFLGCSLLFGHGISDDETLPYFFSKKMNFTKFVLNAGVEGKSTNTILSILNSNIFNKILLHKNYTDIVNYNPKVKRFFYLFVYDHVVRNFNVNPGDRIFDDLIYFNNKFHLMHYPALKKILIRSYIFRRFFLDIFDNYYKQYYETYFLKNMLKIKNIIKEKYDSDLTLVVYKKNKHYEQLNENFIEKLKNIVEDVIVLPDYFNEDSFIIKFDGHPTGKANEEIAEILYNHITKKD